MEQINETFVDKDANNNELKLIVIYPNNKIIQEANLQYNYMISSLIRQSTNGRERLLMRSEIDDYLSKIGIWTKEDANRMEQLGTRIRACELMLKRGGIKLTEGKQIAIEMGELRNQMLQLYNKRQQFDSCTIESTAENHRFNFLVSKCVLIEHSKEPYFKNIDDYISQSIESIAINGAKILAKMIYGLKENIRSTLFEVQWLKRAGFIDDAGRYINEDKQLTDKDGRRISENGRYINENGELIDRNGNLVDNYGDFLVEAKPFINDKTGEPIELN